MARALEDLIADINKRGWTVLNLFQFGKNRPPGMWRCNLQRWTVNGSSEHYYTEFADAPTVQEAVEAALWNVDHRKGIVDANAKVVQTTTLSASQNARIALAMERLTSAVKGNGTRSHG